MMLPRRKRTGSLDNCRKDSRRTRMRVTPTGQRRP